jgi:hypothetical protein
MSLGERCDEIVRLIDEALAEHGVRSAPNEPDAPRGDQALEAA